MFKASCNETDPKVLGHVEENIKKGLRKGRNRKERAL
jgi:hypothetical protein